MCRTINAADLCIWERRFEVEVDALLPHDDPLPLPVVSGHLLFVSIFKPGRIVALSKQSGDIVWAKQLNDRSIAGVQVYNDRVYCHTGLLLYCLKAETGDVLWQFVLPDRKFAVSKLGFSQDCLFWGDKSGTVYCLRQDDGELLWTAAFTPAELNPRVLIAPQILGDKVLVVNLGAAKSVLTLADVFTGRVAWTVESPFRVITDVLVFDGGPVICGTAGLARVCSETGQVTSLREWPAWGARRSISAGDRLFTLLEEGYDSLEFNWSLDTKVKIRVERCDGDATEIPGIPQFLTKNISFCEATGLIYETSYRGLSAVDPVTGVRKYLLRGFDEQDENSTDLTYPPSVEAGCMFLQCWQYKVMAIKNPICLERISGTR